MHITCEDGIAGLTSNAFGISCNELVAYEQMPKRNVRIRSPAHQHSLISRFIARVISSTYGFIFVLSPPRDTLTRLKLRYLVNAMWPLACPWMPSALYREAISSFSAIQSAQTTNQAITMHCHWRCFRYSGVSNPINTSRSIESSIFHLA